MDKNNTYKILVVDDQEIIKAPIIGALIKNDFNVISAKDGMEGYDLAIRENPDLILLDISMPNMNGMDMMAKIRQSGEYGKKVKIILLTSMIVDDKIMKGLVEGEPSFFIQKHSSTVTDIINKVKEALKI